MPGVMMLLVVALLALLAVWALFGIGPGDPEPLPLPPVEPPVLVDLTTLTLRTETVMSGLQSDLHARGLVHEAEGARQMRLAVQTVLEGARHEQL